MPNEREPLTLEQLADLAKRLGMQTFLKRYREPFLVAMGVLETDELAARQGSTTEVRFPTRKTYDRKEIHPLAGRVFRVPVESGPSGEMVIGRDPPAEVVVPEDTVSVRHCAIRWDDGRVFVVDLGSTNGTLVNLRQLTAQEPVTLRSEDIITVGRHSFQFYPPRSFFRILDDLALAKGY